MHGSCEMPNYNPPDEEIKGLLEKAQTIAVVGLSNNPSRDSYRVAQYLKEKGYTIIPVNPRYDEILGEKSYPDLASVPIPIDIVDVFRKIEEVPKVVEDAIKVKPQAIWLQLGLAHAVSEIKTREHNITFIQSKCLKIEHSRYFK